VYLYIFNNNNFFYNNKKKKELKEKIFFFFINKIINFGIMRVITNTNIVVDDFDFCKEFEKKTFIHFLSHFHFDHYEGLTTRWDYGEIFCSENSKNLILHSFPKVKNITAL
jgi:Cft2 family RNA processing exonuclease